MSLVDLIGFIFSFGFFLYMMFQRAMKSKEREREIRQDPHYHEKEEAKENEDLKEFLRSIGVDEDDDDLPEEYRPQPPKKIVRQAPPAYRPPAPPPPRPVLAVQKTTKVIEREVSPYDIEVQSVVPRIERVVNEMPKLRNMLIYHEIFGPPKAYRDEL